MSKTLVEVVGPTHGHDERGFIIDDKSVRDPDVNINKRPESVYVVEAGTAVQIDQKFVPNDEVEKLVDEALRQ